MDIFWRGIACEYQAVIDNVAYRPKDCELLLESLQGRMQKYIITSTSFVYPNLEEAVRFPTRPFRESDAQFVEKLPEIITSTPHEQYVYDKRRMERWLRVNAERFGVHTTVIRPLLQIVGANTDDGRFAWFWMRVRDGGQIWLPEKHFIKKRWLYTNGFLSNTQNEMCHKLYKPKSILNPQVTRVPLL